MQKRIASFLLFISLISSVSASDGAFSLSELLDNLNSETAILVALFLIFFAVINFALSQVFRDKVTGQVNKSVAGVVAFAASFLIVYGINKMDFDLEGFFLDMGISSDVLYTVIPIIFILAAIFLYKKFKSMAFILLGVLFIAIAVFTDWVYEEGALIIIGIVLIGIGLILGKIGKKKIKRR